MAAAVAGRNTLTATSDIDKVEDTPNNNKRRHRHQHNRRLGKQQAGTSSFRGGNGDIEPCDDGSDGGSDTEGQNDDKLRLLLDFIPYFGLGDATHDNMVRSILSAADEEELARNRDQYGNTLLILSCQYRCKGLVPLILSKSSGGAIDLDAVNSEGACALHFACYKDSICAETAMMLLERGAKPEVVENIHGCTPLHYAAGAGDVDLCKRLVGAGAKANKWDFYQYTAVDYAKQSAATDCVRYLDEISAPAGTGPGQATMKLSPGAARGRGGLVTKMGVSSNDLSALFREDSFDDVDSDKDPGSGARGTHAATYGREGGAPVGESDEGYWGKQYDPASGMTYYLNENTGESMWEKDLLSRAHTLAQSQKDDRASPELEQWLRQQTQRARVLAYLGRHDPLRIMEVEDLLRRWLGDEDALIGVLEKQYKAEEDPTVADLIKDVTRGFRGRKPVIGAADATSATVAPLSPSPSPLSPSPQLTIPTVSKVGCAPGSGKDDTPPSVPAIAATTTSGLIAAVDSATGGGGFEGGRGGGGGGRPPTAPSHGPGRRMGDRPASAAPAVRRQRSGWNLISAGIDNKQLLPTAPTQLSPEDAKKLEEEAQKRLEDAKAAHEETLESERQAHRDKAAEGKGVIARMEHDIEEAKTEEERLRAKREEQEGQIESLEKQVREKTVSQSGAVQALSDEASALRAELKQIVDETQALADMADREQSGAAAAVESSRRDAEAKAKEESDLVQSCQAAIATAKADAERTLRKLETRRVTGRQAIEDTLGAELARLQKKLAEAKSKAATDISRAQSDASAATSKAESTAAAVVQVLAEREQLRENLEHAAITAERNGLLQGLVISESERRKKLHNKMEDLKGKIRVYVRVRPFSQKEKTRGCTEAVDAQGKQTIVVQDPRNKEDKNFDFDQVWSGSEESGNNQVNIFKDTGYLVTSAVDGYNVCIFAYGQTGSGKTYTMFGAGGIGGGIDADTGQCDDTAGVTPRAVLELFRVLKERESQYEYSVKVSMFELYRDGLRDLLAKKGSNTKLVIKLAEHSGTGLVVVEGGVEKDANGIKQLIDIIQLGAEGRTVSSTQMNSDSSRSHLLCSIVVSSTNRRTGSCLRGKLTLVDLAGSERVGKSGASGDQLKEAQSINKSLSALGDVIGALTTGVKHIPYRNHALTMMMSDSLGGNSKTLMFVCASPADYNASETINALQFAARCKSVTNSTGGGAGGGAAAAAQVQALRRELEKLKGDGGGKGPVNTPTQLARP